MNDIATAADLSAMEQLRDAKEGPSHLAWCKDADVRHESQNALAKRKRLPRFFTRKFVPECQFIGPLDWRAVGHRPNGGMEN